MKSGMAAADMDLGDAEAPAPAQALRVQEYEQFQAAQASKPAPVLIDNPLTRVISSVIAGRRLHQTSSSAAPAPGPAQARPLTAAD